MHRTRCKKNIIFSLRDQELGLASNPSISGFNALYQLIASDDTSYTEKCTLSDQKRIAYYNGLIYKNCTNCYSIYGESGRPGKLFSMKRPQNWKKVNDDVSYSTPIIKPLEHCTCGFNPCMCLSRCISFLVEGNWFFQYNVENGALMREIYVGCTGQKVKFKYCDWNVYGRQFILSSTISPVESDVVSYLAVFGFYPMEFKAVMEIKRSVFGKNCRHVNVSNQLLLLGMGVDRVHIYNFREVMENGILSPYKLGQLYNDGKVGEHPIGLPLNYTSYSAPPLLFEVKCIEQSVEFGAVPFHCLYQTRNSPAVFHVKEVSSSAYKCIKSEALSTEDIVFFHPDNSNRILLMEMNTVRCFKLNTDNQDLQPSYTMSTHSDNDSANSIPVFSCYGRKIQNRKFLEFSVKSILAVDYEDDLHLFAILGLHPYDPNCKGIIKIYDDLTGKEIKTLNLNRRLDETFTYQLLINVDVIVVTEINDKYKYFMAVYQIKSFAP